VSQPLPFSPAVSPKQLYAQQEPARFTPALAKCSPRLSLGPARQHEDTKTSGEFFDTMKR
jgi:hypothetical protein